MFCDEAYQVSKRIGYGEGLFDALYRKTQTLDYLGKLGEATIYGKKSLKIADSIQDAGRLGKAYFKLAGLYRTADERQTAIDYYYKALEIFKQRSDTAALLAIYNGLALYYNDNSQYDSAVNNYHKAIYYCELVGNTWALGRILGNLGTLYKDLGDYDNAEKYVLLSLENNIKNNDRNDIPKNYSRLGTIANRRGDYQKALVYFNKSDSVLAVTDDSIGIAELAANRAVVYRNMGEYERALGLLDNALAFYKRQNYVDGIIASWESMAMVYDYMGINEKALIYFDSCIVLAEQEGFLERIKDIQHGIYSYHQSRKNYQEALDAYIVYQNLSDSIFDLEKAELINDLRLKYEKEKDQLQILELENENLQRTKQRNLLLFTVLGIILIGIFLIIFLIYNHRKNRIIAAQKIQQLEEEKKHLAARFLVEGEEKERKRVAMELHDNLGVLLSATKMQFSEIRDKSPDNADLITRATKYLEQASSDVRKISHNLMPGLLTKLGLFEALEDLFENLDEHEGMDAIMDVIGPKSRLDDNMEIMIYRMVQEIVNNTLKHAKATKIDMTMVINAEELNISYVDNGKGFDVNETLKKKTLGLQSIQSRVKFLNGLISIISSTGEGTFYRICIPLKEGYCSSLKE